MTLLLSVNSVISLTLISGFIIGHATSQFRVPDNHRWTRLGFVEQREDNCGEDEFECRNGGCIRNNLVCDGRVDCADKSDETRAECTKPGRTCPDGAFRCDYGACAPQNAPCNGIKDCSDNSDELLDECPIPLRSGLLLLRLSGFPSRPKMTAKQPMIDRTTIQKPEPTTPRRFESNQPSTTSTTTPRPIEEPTTKTTTTTSRPIEVPTTKITTTTSRPIEVPTTKITTTTSRPIEKPTTETTTTTTTPSFPDLGNSSSNSLISSRSSIFCLAPPQPANGKWILFDDTGSKDNGSIIPEGAKMKWNSLLYYSCDSGYITKDFPWPRCLSTGKWSRTPICAPRSSEILNLFCPTPEPADYGNWISVECYDFLDSHDPGYTNAYCDYYEGDIFDYGRELYYSCELGYSTDKYPLPRCLPTGNWSRTPVCTEVDDDPDTVLRSCPREQSTTLESALKRSSEPPTDEDLDCLPPGLFCLAPPQPANGYVAIWDTCSDSPRCDHCKEDEFCRISSGTKLEVDEELYYRCDLGYDTEEYPLPRCLPTGEWSRTPVCTKVEEEESPSTEVP